MEFIERMHQLALTHPIPALCVSGILLLLSFGPGLLGIFPAGAAVVTAAWASGFSGGVVVGLTYVAGIGLRGWFHDENETVVKVISLVVSIVSALAIAAIFIALWIYQSQG